MRKSEPAAFPASPPYLPHRRECYPALWGAMLSRIGKLHMWFHLLARLRKNDLT